MNTKPVLSFVVSEQDCASLHCHTRQRDDVKFNRSSRAQVFTTERSRKQTLRLSVRRRYTVMLLTYGGHISRYNHIGRGTHGEIQAPEKPAQFQQRVWWLPLSYNMSICEGHTVVESLVQSPSLADALEPSLLTQPQHRHLMGCLANIRIDEGLDM